MLDFIEGHDLFFFATDSQIFVSSVNLWHFVLLNDFKISLQLPTRIAMTYLPRPLGRGSKISLRIGFSQTNFKLMCTQKLLVLFRKSLFLMMFFLVQNISSHLIQ